MGLLTNLLTSVKISITTLFTSKLSLRSEFKRSSNRWTNVGSSKLRKIGIAFAPQGCSCYWVFKIISTVVNHIMHGCFARLSCIRSGYIFHWNFRSMPSSNSDDTITDILYHIVICESITDTCWLRGWRWEGNIPLQSSGPPVSGSDEALTSRPFQGSTHSRSQVFH